MTAPTVTPPSPFDRHIATLNRTDLMSLLAARHSVRSFTDRPIEEGAVAQLQAEADALNERLGLSIQLCLDNPRHSTAGSHTTGRFATCATTSRS